MEVVWCCGFGSSCPSLLLPDAVTRSPADYALTGHSCPPVIEHLHLHFGDLVFVSVGCFYQRDLQRVHVLEETATY